MPWKYLQKETLLVESSNLRAITPGCVFFAQLLQIITTVRIIIANYNCCKVQNTGTVI